MLFKKLLDEDEESEDEDEESEDEDEESEDEESEDEDEEKSLKEKILNYALMIFGPLVIIGLLISGGMNFYNVLPKFIYSNPFLVYLHI